MSNTVPWSRTNFLSSWSWLSVSRRRNGRRASTFRTVHFRRNSHRDIDFCNGIGKVFPSMLSVARVDAGIILLPYMAGVAGQCRLKCQLCLFYLSFTGHAYSLKSIWHLILSFIYKIILKLIYH